jgi:hypothetical protein
MMRRIAPFLQQGVKPHNILAELLLERLHATCAEQLSGLGVTGARQDIKANHLFMLRSGTPKGCLRQQQQCTEPILAAYRNTILCTHIFNMTFSRR